MSTPARRLSDPAGKPRRRFRDYKATLNDGRKVICSAASPEAAKAFLENWFFGRKHWVGVWIVKLDWNE